MEYTEARKRLVDWLRQQLIGPANKDRLIGISPLDRYPTGVLCPVELDVPSGIDPAASGGDADSTALEDEQEDAPTGTGDESEGRTLVQPVRRRRYVPPSSVGFSFFVRGAVRLSIAASAAVYKHTGDRDEKGRFRSQEYERTELGKHFLAWSDSGAPDGSIWEDRAGIDVRARPYRDGVVLTVTLYNRQRLGSGPGRAQERIEKSLFEARVECIVETGELVEYPRIDPGLLTEEEQELELQYKDRLIYAVGHGAAVDWDAERHRPPHIWSEFMPTAETPMMTVDTGSAGEVLELARLAREPLHDELEGFVEGYARWIEDQRRRAADFQNVHEQAAARRICDRMAAALKRMRRCVELLRSDPLAARSFRLANRAMLNQMQQTGEDAGEAEAGVFRWRPFQLAFLLTVMESTIREEDDFRDVLDLIWFPTGGGKTEAYLGLIAFLIVWRRLKYPDTGGGTVALMRYTLRLLTRQQFERAVRIICALELIRREDPSLGKEPITAGIWVGGASTPNTFREAEASVAEIDAGRSTARHALLLDQCPWCRTPFDISNYDATASSFHFRCINGQCAFGKDGRPLPCNVVDDALYKEPPSLLISTVDKFARVAWEQRTGAFFGAGQCWRPPELVIQDELHLITGPLGSVAGLYEAGFDTLFLRRGVRPKYIASTATIRMAKEQVRCLYARDLAVFPPPGLSCDDSYFARTDNARPGRLYVGYLAPMLDQQHCLAPLAAALLAGPQWVFDRDQDRDELLEAWWTQVIYHGSLKGVGNSHNAFVTDVRDFGGRLAGELSQGGQSGAVEGGSPAARRSFSSDRFQTTRIAQLTSMQTAQEIAETFQRLTAERGSAGCLDAVLATNMVSVGLDVPRLALMVVNGQPLTTAEYIQATSRVGRGEAPGLVFANYYRHQARSLSHYESFRPYHESFYRFVEPSSVTPFTYQVRSRALHAALVSAIRHGCDRLRGNKSAGEFDVDSEAVQVVVAELKQRCERAAESGQAADIATHIDRLVHEWHEEALRCRRDKRQLSYHAKESERNEDRLLRGHDEVRAGLWRTLHSMRNVESSGVLKLNE